MIVIAVLAGILGLLLGFLGGVRKLRPLEKELGLARENLQVARTEVAGLTAMLNRERQLTASSSGNLEVAFEGLSSRVLSTALERFSQGQDALASAREARLDAALRPLETQLGEYRRVVEGLGHQTTQALGEVRSSAAELLAAQERARAETQRLNRLLGRGDQRGRWGEVQLANVLNASGLRSGIDFTLQVTTTSSEGRLLRPDAVINLPGPTYVAVDAKFPFDAFEAALDIGDEEQRRAKYKEHAAALRAHVRALRDKAYWEALDLSPEFVVCFVPSDFAITAAFDADGDLHGYAAKERVLICGPTTLLALLWSVALVVRQNEARVNATEILRLAETLVERIRLVAEPVEAMGRSLESAVDHYNKMVRSVETRLMPLSRSTRALGAASRSKEAPELGEVTTSPQTLNADKWGTNTPASLFGDDLGTGF